MSDPRGKEGCGGQTGRGREDWSTVPGGVENVGCGDAEGTRICCFEPFVDQGSRHGEEFCLQLSTATADLSILKILTEWFINERRRRWTRRRGAFGRCHTRCRLKELRSHAAAARLL